MSTQLFPTLYDPMDYAVHGILQARLLEWVAFPFSRGSSQPGIIPRSPASQVDSLPAESQGKPKELLCKCSWSNRKRGLSQSKGAAGLAELSLKMQLLYRPVHLSPSSDSGRSSVLG